jgi:DNA-binding CsgD family transcriptional regulator
VDDGGVVLALNESARNLLAARDGVYLEGDRIRIAYRAREAQLRRILKGIALAGRFGLDVPPARALRAPRPSGLSPWILQVFPIDRRMPGTATIFITAPEDARMPAAEDLSELFELSPMQRRIAVDLYVGQSPNEVGERLGITRNTLKTHFRRLFHKLGVSRQTDLVRLLSRLKPRG